MGDCSGEIKWIVTPDNGSTSDINYEKLATPKYSAFGERIRHVAPGSLQCSMFCGGRQCKYCNPAKFKENEMTINGLYSSWVTEKILATSRPSTEAMKQFKIIDQFHKNGIKSIINLQLPGEHAACGFGLESGRFSYVPQDFMDDNIFFYNFGWNDYGVRSLQSILDMVKVMDFAISKGKAAVHCHAGLGRTGVLIACYLIYSERLSSHEAIIKMRESRPKAIQTRGQITCVKDFELYIRPMWIIFANDNAQFTLEHFMSRQRHLLHGEEARTLKFIPKIIYTICQRFLTLADIDFDLSICTKITRFSFMRDCALNSSKDCSNLNNNETLMTPKPKILLKTLSNTDLPLINEQTVDSFESQIKANSTPDISFRISLTDESYDQASTTNEGYENNDQANESNNNLQIEPITMKGGVILEPSNEGNGNLQNGPIMKKGGVILEPLKARGSKKKKKGLKEECGFKPTLNEQDNVDSVLSSSIDSNIGTNAGSLLLNSSLDSTIHFLRKSSLKSDTISLASFSSTANEGLSQSEIALKYLAYRSSDVNLSNRIERHKRKLNSDDNAWESLVEETNMAVLSGLLWSWLSHLESPVVKTDAIAVMKTSLESPEKASEVIDRDTWKLLECILTCVSKLDGKQEVINRVLRRFAIIMTRDDSIPRTSSFCLVEVRSDEYKEDTPGVTFFRFTASWLKRMKLK